MKPLRRQDSQLLADSRRSFVPCTTKDPCLRLPKDKRSRLRPRTGATKAHRHSSRLVLTKRCPSHWLRFLILALRSPPAVSGSGLSFGGWRGDCCVKIAAAVDRRCYLDQSRACFGCVYLGNANASVGWLSSGRVYKDVGNTVCWDGRNVTRCGCHGCGIFLEGLPYSRRGCWLRTQLRVRVVCFFLTAGYLG